MSTGVPPPSYSPKRPPPPYSEENNRNEDKENNIADNNYKVSPPPFVPLSSPTIIDAGNLQSCSTAASTMPAQTATNDDSIKISPSFISYDAYCTHCSRNINTVPQYKIGTLTWIVFVIIFVIFFPLSFAPFCLDSFKDSYHHCPHCGSLIGVKKRI